MGLRSAFLGVIGAAAASVLILKGCDELITEGVNSKADKWFGNDRNGSEQVQAPTTPEDTRNTVRGVFQHLRAGGEGALEGAAPELFDSEQPDSSSGGDLQNRGGDLQNRCFVINGVEHGNCP